MKRCSRAQTCPSAPARRGHQLVGGQLPPMRQSLRKEGGFRKWPILRCCSLRPNRWAERRARRGVSLGLYFSRVRSNEVLGLRFRGAIQLSPVRRIKTPRLSVTAPALIRRLVCAQRSFTLKRELRRAKLMSIRFLKLHVFHYKGDTKLRFKQ